MANFTNGKIKKRVRGRYSIKSVLHALVPELSYNDIDIKEGGLDLMIETLFDIDFYIISG